MNQKYRIEFAPAAERQLNKFSQKVQQQVLKRVEMLKLNPRPDGCKKLAGVNSFYRIRTGDYRVIYNIDDQVLLILVVKIGNRKDVYRDF